MEFDKSSKKLRSDSPVINFYTGRSVFITGCTGFLGTVILEKLLFTCGHNIKHIYILIKQKDGQSINEKVSRLFNSRAFERLREHNPKFMEKVIPIGGDILKKSIGLNEKDISVLQNEVSVVFHSAADTSFDMKLGEAVNVNTKATEELLKICKDMHQLTAFVYVSTAYSNCHRSVIDEKVYPAEVPLETIYELLEYSKNNQLLLQLLNGRPNTYTYSKALTEDLIESYANIVPSVIVRPSIILSSVKDPTPGWLNGWNGLSAVIYFGMMGYIKCWHANRTLIADTIPVDYVANIIIVSAWDAYVRSSKNDKNLKVFNCCSGLQNPINLQSLTSICLEHNKKHEKDKSKTNTMFILLNNFYVYSILAFLLHVIPAIIIDLLNFLLGRQMTMFKNLKKTEQLSSSLKHFSLKQFLFLDKNVRNLYQSLNELDKYYFDFDVKNIKWTEYTKSFVIGMKEFNTNKKTTSQLQS